MSPQDVAVKVFSKQEYSAEVIESFKQEVLLMKRLRHPNVLLFMGAVTSPQRLCIVSEFLPRFGLISFGYYSHFRFSSFGPHAIPLIYAHNHVNYYLQWKSLPSTTEEHVKTGLEAAYPYGLGHCKY
jgi:serine/threonine protein kinase